MRRRHHLDASCQILLRLSLIHYLVIFSCSVSRHPAAEAVSLTKLLAFQTPPPPPSSPLRFRSAAVQQQRQRRRSSSRGATQNGLAAKPDDDLPPPPSWDGDANNGSYYSSRDSSSSSSSSPPLVASREPKHEQPPPLFVDGTTTTAARNSASELPSHRRDNDKGQDGSRDTEHAYAEAAVLRQSFARVASSLGTTKQPHDATVALDDARRRINIAIAQRGQAFREAPGSVVAPGEHIDSDAVLSSSFDRVPGCVATVRVRSTLVPVSFGGGDRHRRSRSYRVVVDGDADALLSGGLLALLSDALSGEDGETRSRTSNGQREGPDDGRGGDAGRAAAAGLDLPATAAVVTAEDILKLDPTAVADMLGLREVLSVGRNDGLESMTRVVQGQISDLLSSLLPLSSSGNSHGNGEQLASVEAVSESQSAERPAHGGAKERRPTVAMLLSGGVDSSVALNLLVRQNYDVTAFYLKIWLEDELAHLGQCPWEDDYRVCEAVCDQAGVPLETISLQAEYRDRVVSYTVAEAERGRTPNPDIMCNSRVKFGCFYDAIEGRGFDYVASGHYAQLVQDSQSNAEGEEKMMRLVRAPDPVKDQSYFLCTLTQDQLRRVIFPIGKYQKSEVRDLARQFDLPNKDRPDSQGLCFLGKVKFDEFLSAYLGTNPGDIVDAATGRVIGRHNGLWYHTVGQRKGIGKVLNSIETSRGPWYIVAKDKERNTLIASNEYDEETFQEARSDFYLEDIAWIAGSPPRQLVSEGDGGGRRWKEEGARLSLKIRHGPTIVEGTLRLDESNELGTAGRVHLDVKDKGLAPGQYAVFYGLDDEECLGAGVISDKHWINFLRQTDKDSVEIEAT